MIADMGMVLMMVVPCLVVVGDIPLMLRIVGLFPVTPDWEVVMIVVGLPSAEVTSFNMVPAGRGPFVWGEKQRLQPAWRKTSGACLRSFKLPPVFPALMQIADLYDMCERVSGSLACDS